MQKSEFSKMRHYVGFWQIRSHISDMHYEGKPPNLMTIKFFPYMVVILRVTIENIC